MGAYYYHQYPGDVNEDLSVDVLDYVLIVAYISGTEDLTADQYNNADVNNDDMVNIVDVVILVDCSIRDDCEQLGRKQWLANNGHADLRSDSRTSLARADDQLMVIIIENDVPVRGLQVTVDYDPDLYAVTGVELTEMAAGLNLEYNTDVPGTMNLVLYPDDLYEIPSGEHEIIFLSFTGLSRNTFSEPELLLSDHIYAGRDGNIIQDKIDVNLPVKFAVHPTYPNPFNPITTISYELSKDAFVSIEIFDMTGRKITDLESDNKSAGSYHTQWDARQHASGLYFVRFKAMDFVETRKMMLMK